MMGGRNRTEIISVRLDVRTRYAAELAAAKQRRPLSGFVEWAVGEAIGLVPAGGNQTIADVVFQTWDPVESDRLINLGLHFPAYLSADQEMIWKVIKEHPGLKKEGVVDRAKVRKHWKKILEVVVRFSEPWELDVDLEGGEA